jgi:predicted nucleotidyltransferase component of viral defense system
MLTRQQLERIAQRERIGLQAQERDYIQHLLLARVFALSQEMVFKGGTALRIVHRGARYSEDLDFNARGSEVEIQRSWSEVLAGLGQLGVQAELREAWRGEQAYSFDVSYRGPLYDGRDRSKGKVRVDLSLRGESVETRQELVSPAYDDVRAFVVSVLAPEHLLAEKVRALVMRGKPRDVYDLWFMRGKGWRIDWGLVDRKLATYDLRISGQLVQAALDRVAQDWERDLRMLLPQPVPYNEVRSSVEDYLHRP